jgi:thiamine transporter ThiT
MSSVRMWVIAFAAGATVAGLLVGLVSLGLPVLTPVCEILLFPGYLVASVIGATAEERPTAFIVAMIVCDWLLYSLICAAFLRFRFSRESAGGSPPG